MATFRIAVSPTFAFTAVITSPGGDTQPLPLIGRAMTRKEFTAWREEAQTAESDAEWLMRALRGYGGEVRDQNDQPAAFNAASIAAILDKFPAALHEITAAYTVAHWDARAGN